MPNNPIPDGCQPTGTLPVVGSFSQTLVLIALLLIGIGVLMVTASKRSKFSVGIAMTMVMIVVGVTAVGGNARAAGELVCPPGYMPKSGSSAATVAAVGSESELQERISKCNGELRLTGGKRIFLRSTISVPASCTRLMLESLVIDSAIDNGPVFTMIGGDLVMNGVNVVGTADSALNTRNMSSVSIVNSSFGFTEPSDFRQIVLSFWDSDRVELTDSQVTWTRGQPGGGAIATFGPKSVMHLNRVTVGLLPPTAPNEQNTMDAISFSNGASGSVVDVVVNDAGTGSALELHDAGAVKVNNLDIRNAGRSGIVVFGTGELDATGVIFGDDKRSCSLSPVKPCDDVLVFTNHAGRILVTSTAPFSVTMLTTQPEVLGSRTDTTLYLEPYAVLPR